MPRMRTDNSERLLSLVFLSRITFLSLAEKINLLKNIDSSRELALMSIEDFRRFVQRDLKVSSFDGRKNLKEAETESKIIALKNIGLLYYEDSDYPALLRETVNAPFVLFYRGNKDCILEKSVSVVGTRLMTPDGRKAAGEFSYEAVLDGVNVVSGLAKGVDSAAHKGALDASFDLYEKTGFFPKAKTIAVLPCGIDTVVPSGHKRLAENIIRTGGCIVSEYVPGTPSQSFRFVQRNRIIASLSQSTVVIQAPDGSGSLITADFALEYNRDLVFHEACFSENAGIVRKNVRENNAKEISLGKMSGSKAERRLENYISQGAPVIKDYRDFCECLKEAPGTRNAKNQQMTLF